MRNPVNKSMGLTFAQLLEQQHDLLTGIIQPFTRALYTS